MRSRPRIAGTPHVRISHDGGRTYPARHARPLPAEPPDQPCTVPVYDPGSGTGRMLALDLDPGRVGDSRAEVEPPGGRARPAARAPRRPVRRRRLAVRRPPRLRPVRRAAAVARAARRRPGPGAPVSRRSTRRRCPASAARSPLLAAVTSPAAGGCSRRRWRTPGRPSSTRTGRRYGPRCWPSSRPSCGRLSDMPATADVDPQLRPSWTTPASRGCPASAAAPRSALSLSRSPAPDGGTVHATRAAARRVWRSWALRWPAAGGWPRCGRRSPAEPGRAWPGCTSGAPSPAGWNGSCPLEWRKCIGKISGEENVRQWHTSDLSTRPPVEESAPPRSTA